MPTAKVAWLRQSPFKCTINLPFASVFQGTPAAALDSLLIIDGFPYTSARGILTQAPSELPASSFHWHTMSVALATENSQVGGTAKNLRRASVTIAHSSRGRLWPGLRGVNPPGCGHICFRATQTPPPPQPPISPLPHPHRQPIKSSPRDLVPFFCFLTLGPRAKRVCEL